MLHTVKLGAINFDLWRSSPLNDFMISTVFKRIPERAIGDIVTAVLRTLGAGLRTDTDTHTHRHTSMTNFMVVANPPAQMGIYNKKLIFMTTERYALVFSVRGLCKTGVRPPTFIPLQENTRVSIRRSMIKSAAHTHFCTLNRYHWPR